MKFRTKMLRVGAIFAAALLVGPAALVAGDGDALQSLAPLEGTWVAAGEGFTSQLTYEWALPGLLLRVRNELRNPAGEIFRRYEGNYAWDPEGSTILFWTVGGNGELHRGTAGWREGRLWHEGVVSGGSIAGYRSVLEPVGEEWHYRAAYKLPASDPEILGGAPLVYRKVSSP